MPRAPKKSGALAQSLYHISSALQTAQDELLSPQCIIEHIFRFFHLPYHILMTLFKEQPFIMPVIQIIPFSLINHTL